VRAYSLPLCPSFGIPFGYPTVNYQATRYRRPPLSRVLARGGCSRAQTSNETGVGGLSSQSRGSRLCNMIPTQLAPLRLLLATEWDLRCSSPIFVTSEVQIDQTTRLRTSERYTSPFAFADKVSHSLLISEYLLFNPFYVFLRLLFLLFVFYPVCLFCWYRCPTFAPTFRWFADVWFSTFRDFCELAIVHSVYVISSRSSLPSVNLILAHLMISWISQMSQMSSNANSIEQSVTSDAPQDLHYRCS